MIRDSIYLDHNATAPIIPEAREAVLSALSAIGNPSSVHAEGRVARSIIEDARDCVAALANMPSASVIFTSGGTEANNHVASLLQRYRVLASAIEHDSLLAPFAGADRLVLIGALRSGVVDLAALERELARPDERPVLVSVMMANNETGVVQPIAEIARLARLHNALVHCDAVQAAGRLVIDMAALGVDYLTLSAHKIGGPKGAGALLVRPGLEPAPFVRGGGQEMGRRAGTENVAAIAGFGAAAACIGRRLDAVGAIADLRDSFEARVRAAAPDAVIYGEGVARIANTSCIGMPGVPAETQVMALDLAGVSVSAGAACTSGKVRPSHVLTAMGHGEDAARQALRISLGPETSAADMARCFEAWSDLYGRTRRRVA